MEINERELAVQAVDILNDFIGDFVTPTIILNLYNSLQTSDDDNGMGLIATHKMCISYIILTLDKWLEFYDKYHSVIPNKLKPECKQLKKEIESRKVRDFRHKCIGHIWDKKNKRPLRNSEINKKLDVIFNNSFPDFINWINSPHSNIYPNTVVSIVETVREQLVQDYSISYNEIKENDL